MNGNLRTTIQIGIASVLCSTTIIAEATLVMRISPTAIPTTAQVTFSGSAKASSTLRTCCFGIGWDFSPASFDPFPAAITGNNYGLFNFISGSARISTSANPGVSTNISGAFFQDSSNSPFPGYERFGGGTNTVWTKNGEIGSGETISWSGTATINLAEKGITFNDLRVGQTNILSFEGLNGQLIVGSPIQEPPTIVLRANRSPWKNPIGNTLGFSSGMDLSFERNAFVFHMDIDYVGQNIDTNRLKNYERGIEEYWSGIRTVKIGGYDYPIDFDVTFNDANQINHSGANAQISINNETCGGVNRSSTTRWCLNQPGEVINATQQMQFAAHEFGHLGLGLLDEYDDLTDYFVPWGAQVGFFDRFGNLCEFNYSATNYKPPTGAWCGDMMAFAGGDTRHERYFEQLAQYIAGATDSPDIKFGFAPVIPDILSLPISTIPLLEAHSVPETPTLLLIFLAISLLVWITKAIGVEPQARVVPGIPRIDATPIADREMQ